MTCSPSRWTLHSPNVMAQQAGEDEGKESERRSSSVLPPNDSVVKQNAISLFPEPVSIFPCSRALWKHSQEQQSTRAPRASQLKLRNQPR